MLRVYVLLVSLICVRASPISVDDLLNSGEILQGIVRNLKPEDYEKFGLNKKSISPISAEDGWLTVPQLLDKYNYSVEVHTVQTSDGYLLEMHRIPKPGATPVLLMHGLLDSSAGWVISGPHSSFAYYLSDLGYDVWMGNCRGTRYSRRHVSIKPTKKKFWDFTFHEIGKIDIPAMIDFVLDKTGFESLHYIGHSQGTMTFFVMCDEKPEYNKKIRSMNALAPVAYLRHLKSPLLIGLSLLLDQIESIAKALGMHEFNPNNFIFKLAGQLLCKKEATTQAICNNILFLITGYNTEELNKTMVPAILGHVPAGASVKQLIHFGQLTRSEHFRQYDHGWFKNLLRYGSRVPPSYDLSKTTAPVALHYSLNDWLADRNDVQRLGSELSNVIGIYQVANPKFNHLDFLFAINSRDQVYKPVVKVIQGIDEKLKAD